MRLLIFLFLATTILLNAQEAIDGAYEFQSDPAKKYSLYIPSSYDEATPNTLMLGLHPFNVNRWDAKAWRDTLINFAEMNDLLLVCPDGGIDGQVDSAIDTAFTSNLLDSVESWYNIDLDQKYIMGFSWGGKTTYTYGLRRTDEFKGFMPIGAAVSFSEVSSIIENATNQAFYLVHGSNDSPSSRYTPLLNGLTSNGSCVESNFLLGVGHTIDFPNRNMILTEAYQWLKERNCGLDSTEENDVESKVFPNPVEDILNLKDIDAASISLYDMNGNTIDISATGKQINLAPLASGIYFLKYYSGNLSTIERIIKI